MSENPIKYLGERDKQGTPVLKKFVPLEGGNPGEYVLQDVENRLTQGAYRAIVRVSEKVGPSLKVTADAVTALPRLTLNTMMKMIDTAIQENDIKR